MADKLSDWLVASDIDGTLITVSRKMPQQNIDAVGAFIGAGGSFTLCSGRNLQSLEPHYIKCGANAPAVFLNGAGIYDFASGRLLSYSAFTPSQEDYIIELADKYSSELDFVLYEPRMIHIVGKTNLLGTLTFLADKLDKKFYSSVYDVPRGNWGKLSFMPHFTKLPGFFLNKKSFSSRSAVADACAELKKAFSCGGFECFPDEPSGSTLVVEVAPQGVNKGNGIIKLADMLGIDSANVAAIGDGDNDRAMLGTVAHAAYCGKSQAEFKALCEYFARPCAEGSVADFLGYLNIKYINK